MGLAAGFGGLGLLAVHRLVRIDIRRAHNELAGFLVAVISVTYAVLLAFIAVATGNRSVTCKISWTAKQTTWAASIVTPRDRLPPWAKPSATTCSNTSTPSSIRNGPCNKREKPDQGWVALRKLHSSIVTIEPTTMGQEVIQAELLKVLNELYSARASRLRAVQGHIPPVVWWIILLGSVITVGFTHLFGFHDFRMHVVMTMTVAASLTLVVVLIVALDRPFRGEVSVSPDAYLKTQKSCGDLPFNAQVGRTGDAPQAVRK